MDSLSQPCFHALLKIYKNAFNLHASKHFSIHAWECIYRNQSNPKFIALKEALVW